MIRRILLGFLLFLAFPGSGRAQILKGRVLDNLTGSPVIDADVILHNQEREVVARGLSNREGYFTVRLSKAGIVFVTIQRIGYASGDSIPVIIPPENTFFLELEITPEGVEVPGIVVTATRQSSWLNRRGFYDRERRSAGTFLDAEEIQAFSPTRVSDVMRRIPGAVVIGDVPYFMRYLGRIGGRCAPSILLDGMRIQAEDLRNSVSIPAGWIAGVEAYKNSADIPPQWRHFGGCGLIVIWTG